MIGADVVHATARGDGVRVAVIDSGIDGANPRLKARLAEFSDVTGTGWTPDVHGTLVAGVIAAGDGDGLAPGGVAPDAQLVGVKACVAQSRTRASARCWSSTLAQGIDLASRRDVRVMNVSAGGPADRLLTRMVDAAVARGIAVVSAAGNDGPEGQPAYPAANEGAIAVTAVDAASELYARATQGAFIDIAAPGVDIMSTGPGGRDRLFSGTSAAAAFGTGAVALLLQGRELTVDALRALLRATARDLGSAGHDGQFGDGLLDVCRAMGQVLGREAGCRP
jgi:subtilisin family serine protease